MSLKENIHEKFKQFKPTSWAIGNKTSIYLLIIFDKSDRENISDQELAELLEYTAK